MKLSLAATNRLFISSVTVLGLVVSLGGLSAHAIDRDESYPQCPFGFYLENGMCVSDTDGPISACDTGTYNSESGMCDQSSVPPTCSSGSILVGNMCVTEGEDGSVSVLASCAEGTELVGDMCRVPSVEASCPEHAAPDSEGLCVFTPFEATCTTGMHLVLSEEVKGGALCVANAEESVPTSEPRNPRHTSTSKGSVLGASTGPETCVPLITQYLWAGKKDNSVEQVRALQTFLNGEMGSTLPVDGIFGAATTKVVRDFQLKYWQDVLAPWVPYGLKTDHTTSGLVFKLTQWKINSLHCAPVAYPMPKLP